VAPALSERISYRIVGTPNICLCMDHHLFTGGPIVVGKVSYCSQVPWIMPASLRDNVVFQRPMQPAQYNAVIDACALNHDLAELPAGDLTELGERGVNLSGKTCWWSMCTILPSIHPFSGRTSADQIST
jgi:hypothetical protein